MFRLSNITEKNGEFRARFPGGCCGVSSKFVGEFYPFIQLRRRRDVQHSLYTTRTTFRD